MGIVVLCVAMFVAAAAVAWGAFEAMPHLDDEHAYLWQAKTFASGRLTNPLPAVPSAFFVPFVVTQDGVRFSKYPPGYSLLLALGVWLGHPWVVNACAAALGLLGVFLLGRDLFDARTGLLAALLGAFAPMYIVLSGTLLAHSVDMAALILFAWAFLRARRQNERHRLAFAGAAGILGGLALATRPYTAFAVCLTFGILALGDLVRQPRAAWPALGLMAVAFLAVGGLWPLYNWATTGSALTNTYAMFWNYDRIGFGPDVGWKGYDLEAAIFSLQLSLRQFNTVVSGWPAGIGVSLFWLAVALGLILPPRKRVERLLLIPPAALITAHTAYWASSAGAYGPRYYAEGMPFLWLLAACGLIKASARRPINLIVKITVVFCSVWSIAMVTLPLLLQVRGFYNISRADMRRVTATGIHHALIFVHSDFWTECANLSWLNEPDLATSDNVFAKDLGVEANAQVMQQFPDRVVYYYDRDNAGPPVHGKPNQ